MAHHLGRHLSCRPKKTKREKVLLGCCCYCRWLHIFPETHSGQEQASEQQWDEVELSASDMQWKKSVSCLGPWREHFAEPMRVAYCNCSKLHCWHQNINTHNCRTKSKKHGHLGSTDLIRSPASSLKSIDSKSMSRVELQSSNLPGVASQKRFWHCGRPGSGYLEFCFFYPKDHGEEIWSDFFPLNSDFPPSPPQTKKGRLRRLISIN